MASTKCHKMIGGKYVSSSGAEDLKDYHAKLLREAERALKEYEKERGKNFRVDKRWSRVAEEMYRDKFAPFKSRVVALTLQYSQWVSGNAYTSEWGKSTDAFYDWRRFERTIEASQYRQGIRFGGIEATYFAWLGSRDARILKTEYGKVDRNEAYYIMKEVWLNAKRDPLPSDYTRNTLFANADSILLDYIKKGVASYDKGGMIDVLLEDVSVKHDPVRKLLSDAESKMREAVGLLWQNNHPSSDKFTKLYRDFEKQLGDILSPRDLLEINYADGGFVDDLTVDALEWFRDRTTFQREIEARDSQARLSKRDEDAFELMYLAHRRGFYDVEDIDDGHTSMAEMIVEMHEDDEEMGSSDMHFMVMAFLSAVGVEKK